MHKHRLLYLTILVPLVAAAFFFSGSTHPVVAQSKSVVVERRDGHRLAPPTGIEHVIGRKPLHAPGEPRDEVRPLRLGAHELDAGLSRGGGGRRHFGLADFHVDNLSVFL